MALWVGQVHRSQQCPVEEIAANAALVLLTVACTLLDRQIATLAETFRNEGGFTERLYRERTAMRKEQNKQ